MLPRQRHFKVWRSIRPILAALTSIFRPVRPWLTYSVDQNLDDLYPTTAGLDDLDNDSNAKRFSFHTRQTRLSFPVFIRVGSLPIAKGQ